LGGKVRVGPYRKEGGGKKNRGRERKNKLLTLGRNKQTTKIKDHRQKGHQEEIGMTTGGGSGPGIMVNGIEKGKPVQSGGKKKKGSGVYYHFRISPEKGNQGREEAS